MFPDGKGDKDKLLYICLMQVNDALIDKLSKLSMLQFSDEEKEEIKADLEKMIGFVSLISIFTGTAVLLFSLTALNHLCLNKFHSCRH